MPFVLRRIRKARWDIGSAPWLSKDDIHADPLADLTTKNNVLSVWHVEDDRSNLEHVVTALAASCDDISNVDYALCNQQFLSEINIKITETKGGSPDEKVNTSWHRDLIELSALKIVELAKTILMKAERERIPEKRILRLIARAVVSGRIERKKLKPRIGEKIDKLITTERHSS